MMRRLLLLTLLFLLSSTVYSQSTIKITTANLQHGEGTDGSTNYSRQITKIMEDSPDIIVVQERTTGDTGWDAPMAAAGLVQAVWRENAPSPHQGDGPAIWYKSSTVTITQVWSHDLITGQNPNCGTTPNVGNDCSTLVTKAAVAAQVSYGGRQFYVVGTHLCWSLCNDSPATTTSVQRENQINDLKSWVNTVTGGSPNVVIGGDMNLAPNSPKIGGGFQKSLFTSNYTDLWNAGITASVATANWGDRDANGSPDMPVSDLGTRTHDTRRIDYFFLKIGATNLSLSAINVPDSRATCSTTLTNNWPPGTSVFKECPDVVADSSHQWDVPDDQGVRVSDHNFMTVTLNILGPIASLTCPLTAFVGEPIVCDGSASSGVNGQVGSSTQSFASGSLLGSAPVDMDYGDNQGQYSHSTLLKGPHVYLSAATYTVTLTVKDSAGIPSSISRTITVTNIPAATSGNIITLTDQGSESANRTALQNALDTAYGANTVEKEICLPVITYVGPFTVPVGVGTKYVTLRPCNTSGLPGPLQRVTPSNASIMPKIQSHIESDTQTGVPLRMPAGRSYFRMLGIEVNRTTTRFNFNLVEVGTGGGITTYSDLPHHVIIDRCYIHGNTFDDSNRGVLMNAITWSIINSHFQDFHVAGADAQSIAGLTGQTGAIVNNWLDGYGENILFGGSDTGIKFSSTCVSGVSPTGCTLSSVANLRVGDGMSLLVAGTRGPWSATIVRSITGNVVTWDQITNQAGTPTAPDTTASAVKYGASPQDLFIARNYLFKDLFYKCTDNPLGGACVPDPAYNGTYRPTVKNSFELKHAMRVRVVGNIIQNHWGAQGQSGPSVLFTVRNQTCFTAICEQSNPWAMVRDVEFSYNKVLNIADFINILGTDNLNPGNDTESGPSAFVQYIQAEHNQVKTNQTAMVGGGAMIFIFPGARHITVNHQTAIDPDNNAYGYIIGSTTAPIGQVSADVKIVNSIFKHLQYGFIAEGHQAGDAMAIYFPDGHLKYNVISNDLGTATGLNWSTSAVTPNYFAATINTNTFANYTNCLAGGSCALSSTSPYKAGNATPAADGTDIGINDAAVTAATLFSISGDWSGGVPVPFTTCRWSTSPRCQ